MIKFVNIALKNNIIPKQQKLDIGDYQFEEDTTISVDVKKIFLKYQKNIFQENDKDRFIREIMLAKSNHTTLIILIEENYTINTLKDWKSPLNAISKPYTYRKGFEIANRIRYYEKSISN